VSSLLTRKDMLTALRSRLDAWGGGAAHFYAAPQAANEEAPPAGPPLAIVALAAPTCGVVANSGSLATLALAAVSGLVAANGQIAWVRFVDGAGVAVEDKAAGLPGSGAPVIYTDNQPTPSADVFVGGVINIVGAVWAL
jgi:hypothetical protein